MLSPHCSRAVVGGGGGCGVGDGLSHSCFCSTLTPQRRSHGRGWGWRVGGVRDCNGSSPLPPFASPTRRDLAERFANNASYMSPKPPTVQTQHPRFQCLRRAEKSVLPVPKSKQSGSLSPLTLTSRRRVWLLQTRSR